MGMNYLSRRGVGGVMATLLLIIEGRAQVPTLVARYSGTSQVQLVWATTEGVVLEESSRLGTLSIWTPASSLPVTQNGESAVTVDANASELYFRLRRNPARGLATLSATSPAQGAAGVSVNREAIFRFSEPLAANTLLSTEWIHAEVGSRRILSRAELSSDRRRITLFHLEPLPSSARVRLRLDGSRLSDDAGRLVDADGDGLPGGWAEIQYDTMNAVPIPGTAVSGYVYDSALVPTAAGPTNKPLAGVIITVDGSEQSVRAVTDADGFFILNPCPTGRFFVHIDGRQADGSEWPDGAYYPFVGKTFVGGVGRTNSVPGGVVYLPWVPASTLRPVSSQSTTEINLPASVLAARPELAGLQLTLAPNTLFGDDGTRGGRLGIAVVPPERLPAPLPPGLEPSMVITVQTDGPMNFDQPVPIQFPNLPDPRTGKPLGPGEKSMLWSFNHDTGNWEPQGLMTVSADGKYVVTDPGVGILQPGWNLGVPTWARWPQPQPPSFGGGCQNGANGANLALEYLEWQLKAGECALRMAALLSPTVQSSSQSVFALVQSSASMLAAMPNMITSLNNLATAVQSGSSGAALGALLGVIQAEKQAITPLGNKLFARPTPAQQILGAVQDLGQCLLEMANEQLDFTCGIVPCILGNTPQVARQQAFCNAAQAGINTVLNSIAAYNFKNSGSFGRLCGALDQLAPLLNSYIAGLGPNSAGREGQGPRPAAGTLQEEILAELQNALAAAAELQRDLQPTVDLQNQGLDYLNTYSNYLAAVDGSMLLRLNAHANSYYKLTSGSFTTRGRTTALGGMELPGIGLTEAYSFSIYDPARNAVSEGNAAPPGLDVLNTGAPIYLPEPVLRIPGINDLSGDTDGDGLTDLAEDVIGTRRDAPDTDGDGVSDFAEVRNGQDPLSGLAFPVGPVAAVPLPGNSRAIDIEGTTAYLAQGSAGLALVDLTNPLNPIAVGQFSLPGDCQDVAYSSSARTAALISLNQAAEARFLLVDLADPRQPGLLRNFPVAAQFVSEAGGVYYVSVDDQVRMYDATFGREIGWLAAEARISGVLATESHIFVTTDRNLSIFQRGFSAPALLGRVAGNFAAADGGSSVPMVLDGSRLWVGTSIGLYTVDIADPGAPRVLNAPGSNPRAVRKLSLSAGKRMVALTAAQRFRPGLGGQTSVYDVSDPTSSNKLNFILDSRGAARDAALHLGWLILADELAGLTVMNLQGFDTAGVAPAITWTLDVLDVDPTKPGVQLEEGHFATFRPSVTDDIEVDSTELLVNGAVVEVSRTIPPVFQFQLPTLASGVVELNLQVRSRDRSGNTGFSDNLTIELVPDTQAPTLLSPSATSGFAAFSNWPLVFRFSEDLSGVAWQAGSMTLQSVGRMDGDDSTIPLAAASVVGASANLRPVAPLPPGRYRLTLPKETVRDSAGNIPAANLELEFYAFATEPETAVWISPAPGRYHEPINWLHARVPNQVDVLIQLPGVTPAVSLDANATARNLIVAGPFAGVGRFGGMTVLQEARFLSEVQWDGGNLFLGSLPGGGQAVFERGLSFNGGTLTTTTRLETRELLMLKSGGSLVLDGGAAQLVAGGGLEVVNATVLVRNGAVLELPQFQTHDSPGDFVPLFPVASTFRSQGSGSRLSFPNLGSGKGPENSNVRGAPSLRFEAVDGGSMNLPKLTALTGRTTLIAEGLGSLLDAPLLTQTIGPETSVPSAIEAVNLGRVQVPALTLVERCAITERTGGVVARGTP